MNNFWRIIFVFTGVLSVFVSCNRNTAKNENADVINVCINKIIDHEALNETIRGIQDILATSKLQFRVTVESSQGSSVMAQQLTDKFVSGKANVIIGVGTIAAQSFMKYAKDGRTRFVYSSVTDPKSAGLTGKQQISGVSNFVELVPQIDLFLEILPKLKRLGFLYNPGEANSVMLISELKEILAKRGITLVLQTATRTFEIQQAVENLVSKVDAIFISNDNTALSAFKCIRNIAGKNKIPVFVSDTDIVHKGALAALGPNQYKIGEQTANLVLKQIKDKTFESLIEYPRKEDTLLIVNQRAAQKCDIELPDSVLKRAHKILVDQ